jgi:hypothetical protein
LLSCRSVGGTAGRAASHSSAVNPSHRCLALRTQPHQSTCSTSAWWGSLTGVFKGTALTPVAPAAPPKGGAEKPADAHRHAAISRRACSTGAGGENGTGKMWNRREISARSYYDQSHDLSPAPVSLISFMGTHRAASNGGCTGAEQLPKVLAYPPMEPTASSSPEPRPPFSALSLICAWTRRMVETQASRSAAVSARMKMISVRDVTENSRGSEASMLR